MDCEEEEVDGEEDEVNGKEVEVDGKDVPVEMYLGGDYKVPEMNVPFIIIILVGAGEKPVYC